MHGLLTVILTPLYMNALARDAFMHAPYACTEHLCVTRVLRCAGRKSGIWQGTTEVELQQLERQWDDYKVSQFA